jgi:hypothetical protein
MTSHQQLAYCDHLSQSHLQDDFQRYFSHPYARSAFPAVFFQREKSIFFYCQVLHWEGCLFMCRCGKMTTLIRRGRAIFKKLEECEASVGESPFRRHRNASLIQSNSPMPSTLQAKYGFGSSNHLVSEASSQP